MLDFESPDLGDQIKRARTKLGMSQTALAEKIGISGGYLSSIESGASRPSAGLQPKIKKAINGTVIVDDDEEPLETLIQKIVDRGYDVSISRHA